jgi:hypothetical protein
MEEFLARGVHIEVSLSAIIPRGCFSGPYLCLFSPTAPSCTGAVVLLLMVHLLSSCPLEVLEDKILCVLNAVENTTIAQYSRLTMEESVDQWVVYDFRERLPILCLRNLLLG